MKHSLLTVNQWMEITTYDGATKGFTWKLYTVLSLKSSVACIMIWKEVIHNFFCLKSFSYRLQRPNVFLPVHLYGQLVHDKTGCHLLEAQVCVFKNHL